MAKTVKKDSVNPKKNSSEAKISYKFENQHKVVFGFFLILLSVALLVAFISFFISGQADQSAVNALTDRAEVTENWLGKIGAFLADIFIYQGFGIASFVLVILFFLTGAYLVMGLPLKKLKSTWFWNLYAIIILSILLGFFFTTLPELGGVIGYEMN